MAQLELKGDHNKYVILKKVKGHEEFDLMVEFLQRSKIHYALTHCPNLICESMVNNFGHLLKRDLIQRLLLKLMV